MALTRKFLAAMGISAEQIEQIIEAHLETVTGLKDEAAKLQAQADRVATLEAELKKHEGKDYDSLRKEFDEYKAEVQTRETRAAKERAYRAALKDANLTEKGIEKAIKYANWEAIELDEDGELKDAAGHVKAVREEWAEYIARTETRGAETANPPANNGGRRTKEEIMAITDTAERQRAIAENHDIFGF